MSNFRMFLIEDLSVKETVLAIAISLLFNLSIQFFDEEGEAFIFTEVAKSDRCISSRKDRATSLF